MMIILGTYIASITVEGLRHLLAQILESSGVTMASMGIPLDATMIALAKIILFALCIIIFMIKSGIFVSYDKEAGSILTLVYTGLFGFAAAGLIVSTILSYAAGSGILDAGLIANASPASSTLMQLMIVYQELWFALPALLIIILAFLHKE